MPLNKARTKKALRENIRELIRGKPGKTRAKAIRTIAKKHGISEKQAKLKQAKAIARDAYKKGKSRKKRTSKRKKKRKSKRKK